MSKLCNSSELYYNLVTSLSRNLLKGVGSLYNGTIIQKEDAKMRNEKQTTDLNNTSLQLGLF